MIAGNAAAVDRACEILKAKGAKRAIKLNVSAPFHCDLMLPAQEKLAADLKIINFSDLEFPIVENVTGEFNESAGRVSAAITLQVSSPVRWSQSILKLVENGVETFVEVGAGKILSGLVRQIDRSVRCLNVENKESLQITLENL